MTHHLHGGIDYHRHWFVHFGLPLPNGEHNQLQVRERQIRRLLRRVLQREGLKGGGRGRERPEIQVFSCLNIWQELLWRAVCQLQAVQAVQEPRAFFKKPLCLLESDNIFGLWCTKDAPD